MEENPLNPVNIQEPPALIRPEVAKLSDIEGVIDVQNTVFVEKDQLTKDPSLSERGFLIYKTSRDELKRVIDDPEHHTFLVVKDGEKVIGYLLGYHLNTWIAEKSSWKEGVVLNEKVPSDFLKEKIVYIRQVAVLPGKEGYGVRLVIKFLIEARDLGYDFAIGDILQFPIVNNKSLDFFQKKGFEKIGEVNDGSLVWGLFSKKIV